MSDTPTDVAPDATTGIPADGPAEKPAGMTPEPEPAREAPEAAPEAPEPEPVSEAEPEPVSEAAPESLAAARPPRRALRAALRWTAALLVLASLGGATAYAVTQPERTKLPGLRTPDDGRWTYPPLALPKLPAGRPAPLDDVKNLGGVHYNDMRSLLLPLPEEARTDPALPGVKGWVPTAAYLKKFSLSDVPAAQAGLKEEGLRHIAGRAWTMPDGTRTEIYLAQFLSNAYASTYSSTAQTESLAGVKGSDRDTSVQSSSVPSRVSLYAYDETAPYGATATRYAYILAGDTLALVVQSGKRPGGGGTPAVPFRETVRLQAQMLG